MHEDDADGMVEAASAETTAAFAAALAAGDARAAARAYASQATLLAPFAEVFRGREAIEAFWRAGVASGVAAVDLKPLELERRDDLAYEIGRYRLRVETADGSVVDRGKYVLVHERQPDGSWLRAVETFNPDAPPAGVGARSRRKGDDTAYVDA